MYDFAVPGLASLHDSIWSPVVAITYTIVVYLILPVAGILCALRYLRGKRGEQ